MVRLFFQYWSHGGLGDRQVYQVINWLATRPEVTSTTPGHPPGFVTVPPPPEVDGVAWLENEPPFYNIRIFTDTYDDQFYPNLYYGLTMSQLR
jgi:hypothetical protein